MSAYTNTCGPHPTPIMDQRDPPVSKSPSFFHLVCLLLFVPLFLGSCSGESLEIPTPTPLPAVVSQEKDIFTVRRGPIISQKNFPGEVVPAQQDSLYFLASGSVARVLVEPGDTVKQGDLLTELQMDELYSQLQQARIDLQIAQDNLENLALQRLYDIQKAEADLAVLQIQQEQAQVRFESQSGSLTEDARRDLEIIQERLATAQAWLDLVLQKKDTSIQGSVDRSQLAVDRLEKLVSEHQIVAPFDGIILTSYVKPGINIDAFSTAFLIGDPNELVIRIAYVNELVPVLEPGIETYMSFNRSSDELFPVQYLPGFLPITNKKEGVVTNDPRQALTYFYFSAPEGLTLEQLPIGGGVNLVVIYGRKESALLLSPAAIRGDSDFKYVIVLENDIHRRLELLRIGLKGDTYWEVEGNLQVGDQVLGP